MSTFDNREKQAEAGFSHDQEMEFKAHARRDRLLAEWAAGLLGLKGDAQAAYVKQLVALDVSKPGEQVVFDKLRKDFDANSVEMSDHMLHRKMDELLAEARNQIRSE